MTNYKFQKDIPYFNLLDRTTDLIWAGTEKTYDKRFNNYYDYYFSGEDVKIYIDGLFEPENELDIASFSWKVEQTKQALWGFWSYNYDAIIYGNRAIMGEFSIYTRYPRRMTELLEIAAEKRVNTAKNVMQDYPTVSLLSPKTQTSEDEKNVQKYWSYSQLDRITTDPGNPNSDNKNIFSAHPPFNFVILYGAEEVALSPISKPNTEDYMIGNNLDRMIYADVNQRSVKTPNIASPMKIVIQQVQLSSMGTAYVPGGQAIIETYQFLARDHYFMDVDMSHMKNMFTVSYSNSDTPPSGDTLPGRSASNLQS